MKIDEATVEWINGSSLGVPFFCLSYTAISPMDIYIYIVYFLVKGLYTQCSSPSGVQSRGPYLNSNDLSLHLLGHLTLPA